MTTKCRSVACTHLVIPPHDFCISCLETRSANNDILSEQSISERYPDYYKDVGDLGVIDVYAVHNLFQIQDFSGCIHHASKKLLLSGVRTGSKSFYLDIKEARDSLTRWLHLNESQRKDSQ
jgi:hypothetical protein